MFTNTTAMLEVAEKLRHSKLAVQSLESRFVDQFKGEHKIEDLNCNAYEEDGYFRIGTPFGPAQAAIRLIFEGERALLEYRFLVTVDGQTEEVLRLNLDESGLFWYPGGSAVGTYDKPSTVHEIAVGVIAGILGSRLYMPTPEV